MLDDSSTAQSAVTGRVLVVDDEPDNRELHRTLLEMKGHTVFDAGNGAEALDMVKDALPDVILLDVMMPEMDGYEVCRRLKGDPETAPVPIIMVTALAGRSDRLEGIDAGANDFLTKPVGAQDVILRVRNSIYTKRLYDQVNESLDRLRELEELRDNLTHMIVHDMRSPLMGICGSLELLQMTVADRLDEEDRDDMERALDSSRLLTEMVSSLLDVSRLEAGKMPLHRTVCGLEPVIVKAIDSLGSLARRASVRFVRPEGVVEAYCDADVTRRIITNLLGNAIKFTPPEKEVRIEAAMAGDRVRLDVHDAGPGIPEEYKSKIFQKFGQVESRKEGQKFSTGLGLTFCKLAVEAHGGEIEVSSVIGSGSTFTVYLPATEPPAP